MDHSISPKTFNRMLGEKITSKARVSLPLDISSKSPMTHAPTVIFFPALKSSKGNSGLAHVAALIAFGMLCHPANERHTRSASKASKSF